MDKNRNKTGGRRLGTKNIVSIEMRLMLKSFLLSQWPEVQKSFVRLSDKDKCVAYSRFLNFVCPSYQSISMSLTQMTEQDLQCIVDHLKRDLEGNTIDVSDD